MLTFAAIYFAWHAGNILVLRCAELNYELTITVIEKVILGGSVIVLVGAAINLWRELK